MGKCILIIGGTGQGKSTFIKKAIENKPCLVYDVQGEYSYLPTDINQPQSRFFNTDPQQFIEICKLKHNGTICVFEEATGFFSGRTSKEMKQLILSKRHPVDKGGRNLLFIFHYIQAVPPSIINMADEVVLFKTSDELSLFKNKFPRLIIPFQRVQRLPKYHSLRIKLQEV